MSKYEVSSVKKKTGIRAYSLAKSSYMVFLTRLSEDEYEVEDLRPYTTTRVYETEDEASERVRELLQERWDDEEDSVQRRVPLAFDDESGGERP
jgi:hypothetical protein